MGHVDLDAARAAREETTGDIPTVTLADRTYKLTRVLSIGAADAYRQGDGAAFVRRILADPSEADAFLENHLEWSDLNDILKAWHTDQGKSSASRASSKNGSKRSRQTSKPSTT